VLLGAVAPSSIRLDHRLVDLEQRVDGDTKLTYATGAPAGKAPVDATGDPPRRRLASGISASMVPCGVARVSA